MKSSNCFKKQIMKYVLILFLVIIFTSCDNTNGVKLKLYNETYGVTLDSVRVSTSDKKATIKFTRIDAGDEKTGFLDISRVNKTDGHYVVQSYAGEYTMVKI